LEIDKKIKCGCFFIEFASYEALVLKIYRTVRKVKYSYCGCRENNV